MVYPSISPRSINFPPFYLSIGVQDAHNSIIYQHTVLFSHFSFWQVNNNAVDVGDEKAT